MIGWIETARNYMANAWDRGATIATAGLVLTLLANVGAYYSFRATTETKLDQVIENQNEFKAEIKEDDVKFDNLQADRAKGRRENDATHADTKARVGILENIAKNTSDAIGELKKAADRTYEKVDRLEDLVRDSLTQQKADRALEDWPASIARPRR